MDDPAEEQRDLSLAEKQVPNVPILPIARGTPSIRFGVHHRKHHQRCHVVTLSGAVFDGAS